MSTETFIFLISRESTYRQGKKTKHFRMKTVFFLALKRVSPLSFGNYEEGI